MIETLTVELDMEVADQIVVSWLRRKQMIDTLTVELDMDVADQIVVSWLKDNMKLIEGVYYGDNKGAHEVDEDYKAMKRILEYMTEPGND
jgi:hypothetical protein